MVRLLLLFLTFFTVQTIFSQGEERVLFSEALTMHLPKYEIKAKEAYRQRNYAEAQVLFDSLVNFQLAGSYMDDFKFYRLNKKPISLHDFKKPVYLITYASWCVTSKGEIPAFNELAKEYNDQIDFVVLFWDSQKEAKKAAKSYNKFITILYVDELKNKDAFVVSQLKHGLGLPTTFLLDGNKKILNIKRGVSHHFSRSLEDSIKDNHESIYNGIANHLLGQKIFSNGIDPVAVN